MNDRRSLATTLPCVPVCAAPRRAHSSRSSRHRAQQRQAVPPLSAAQRKQNGRWHAWQEDVEVAKRTAASAWTAQPQIAHPALTCSDARCERYEAQMCTRWFRRGNE